MLDAQHYDRCIIDLGEPIQEQPLNEIMNHQQELLLEDNL
jgi:hypothetical protein